MTMRYAVKIDNDDVDEWRVCVISNTWEFGLDKDQPPVAVWADAITTAFVCWCAASDDFAPKPLRTPSKVIPLDSLPTVGKF